MGAMRLSLCAEVPASPPPYCGRLERPLDPTEAQDGRLSIYFEVYPHAGPGKAVGMLVATEGGPGYPRRNRAPSTWPCSVRCGATTTS